MRKVDFECIQVAIVDTDKRRLTRQHFFNVLSIIKFNQCRHAEFVDECMQISQRFRLEAFGDQ